MAPKPKSSRSRQRRKAPAISLAPAEAPRGPAATLRVSAGDLLDARHHSPDFTAIRTAYLRERLRIVQLVFALGFLAWIPMDFLLLPQREAVFITVARASLGVGLAALWLASGPTRSYGRTLGLIGATVFLLALFYAVSMTLQTNGREMAAAVGGYRALPFVLIALTALFPVTVLVGAALIGITIAMHLAVELAHGTLTGTAALNTLWMLVFIAGMTLWIQGGQLWMLLRLYRESTRDPLTGLLNRRVLTRTLERLWYRDRGRPFSLIMLDIDRFKRINDEHGHHSGDRVLQHVAAVLRGELRSGDLVARYGGEEFLAILPEVGADEAAVVAERLRRAVAAEDVDAVDGERIAVRISLGVSAFRPGEPLESTLRRLDEALYAAKGRGRDCVVSA
ncbi:diguanylate cyclase [Arhodomonas sp. SL1]|uniref:GGDEF domain-containing protein n=1 Tax=Arhodomonas sp. SL1 TaxID=3425691 RepID=UPI003F885501